MGKCLMLRIAAPRWVRRFRLVGAEYESACTPDYVEVEILGGTFPGQCRGGIVGGVNSPCTGPHAA